MSSPSLDVSAGDLVHFVETKLDMLSICSVVIQVAF